MSNELGLQLNISVPDTKEVQAQMVTAKNKARWLSSVPSTAPSSR